MTRVTIVPEDLDKDIHALIMTDLKEREKEFNSREKGSVVEIVKITGYSNKISSSGSASMCVEFEALTFLPHKGQIVEALVEKVIFAGIVCSFFGVRIWIHVDSIANFKWTRNCFSDGEKDIVEGSTIKTKIVTIRYEKKTFSCIGTFLSIVE